MYKIIIAVRRDSASGKTTQKSRDYLQATHNEWHRSIMHVHCVPKIHPERFQLQL